MKKMLMQAIQFDMTGVTAWNPLASPAPEPGHYEATVTEVDPVYNGGKSTKMTLALSSGHTTDIYLGNEPGEKGGNKRKWLQALGSISPDADKFFDHIAKNPALSFDPLSTFKGKKCYVLVVAVPGVDEKGRPNLPDKEFLTKGQFEALKAGAVAPTRAGASASPSPASTNGSAPPPTPGATPTPAPVADPLKALFGG